MNYFNILCLVFLAMSVNGDDKVDNSMEKLYQHWCKGQPDVERFIRGIFACSKKDNGTGVPEMDTCFAKLTGLHFVGGYEDCKERFCQLADSPKFVSQFKHCSNLGKVTQDVTQMAEFSELVQCIYGDQKIAMVKLLTMFGCLEMEPTVVKLFDKNLRCYHQSTGPILGDSKRCFRIVYGKDFPAKWQDFKSQVCSAQDNSLKFLVCVGQSGFRPERLVTRVADEARLRECIAN